MLLTIFLFVLGFALLIKGADFLVDGASFLAKKLKISLIVIGLTVVAFGTSTPELVVNIFASARGSSEIAIGNVLGSNIANILLILGLSAAIFPLLVKHNTVWKEVPLSVLAVLSLFVLANDFLIDKISPSILTRSEAIILLFFFIIFLYYTFSIAKNNDEQDKSKIIEYSISKSILRVILGLAFLVLGGKWVVDGAIDFARFFGVSETLIGLTIVAVGTSLPELATSTVAVFKKNSDIAVGNIVGSNIFNIFFVLGISGIIKPLSFNPAVNNFDIFVVLLASLLLFCAMFLGKKYNLERWQGAGLLILYFVYIGYLIYRG
ncbi:MAG: calcium/sodium antiporter [Patescibacteria group bacterium]